MTAATIARAESAEAPDAEASLEPLRRQAVPGLILPLALIALWYILSTNGVFTQVTRLPRPCGGRRYRAGADAVSWPSTSRFRPSAC